MKNKQTKVAHFPTNPNTHGNALMKKKQRKKKNPEEIFTCKIQREQQMKRLDM